MKNWINGQLLKIGALIRRWPIATGLASIVAIIGVTMFILGRVYHEDAVAYRKMLLRCNQRALAEERATCEKAGFTKAYWKFGEIEGSDLERRDGIFYCLDERKRMHLVMPPECNTVGDQPYAWHSKACEANEPLSIASK